MEFSPQNQFAVVFGMSPNSEWMSWAKEEQEMESSDKDGRKLLIRMQRQVWRSNVQVR